MNLPEFQPVAEFENSLRLDYGRRRCGVSLSRPTCKVFTVCGLLTVGGLHRAHSRVTLSLSATEVREHPPSARVFSFLLKLAQAPHSYQSCIARAAIPHPRLEVREIVSLGAPEAVGQIRIGFVGGGRAGKYPR